MWGHVREQKETEPYHPVAASIIFGRMFLMMIGE
jgi:hypothetical protein